MTADNDNRPPEFDALIEKYTPGLKRLAAKLAPWRGDDLYVDTVILLLHRWRSFRPDGGFWNWASLTMRGAARDQRLRERKQPREVELRPLHAGVTQPSQHDYAELSEALRKLSGVRHGDVLLRRAMGDKLDEIAADRGVSRERIRQLEAIAREDLNAAS